MPSVRRGCGSPTAVWVQPLPWESLWGNVQKGAVVKGVSDLRVTLAMDSHHSMDVVHSPLSMLSMSGTWEIDMRRTMVLVLEEPMAWGAAC